ncbi:MAG: hypothetical protein E6G67_11085 [Actinobacteria bacterium]|nr:MAG: hypothetical protein E6G67_11085 [Actinomycetota bacterium]
MLAPCVGINVLHISESDAAGGAARTAYKLHRGLNGSGHHSRMLVGRRVTRDESVRRLKRSLAWRGADRLCGAILDPLDLQYVFYPSSFGVARDRWFREADLLQLHNLHGSYFSYTALPALTRRRPAVWLLQDQWAFTGHVAYSLDCERWRDGCGSCPYLAAYPRLRRDRTALLWRLKRSVYRRSRLTLIVPSRWMQELVQASPLLRHFPVQSPGTVSTYPRTGVSSCSAPQTSTRPAKAWSSWPARCGRWTRPRCCCSPAMETHPPGSKAVPWGRSPTTPSSRRSTPPLTCSRSRPSRTR